MKKHIIEINASIKEYPNLIKLIFYMLERFPKFIDKLIPFIKLKKIRLIIFIFIVGTHAAICQEVILSNYYKSESNNNGYINIVIKEDTAQYVTIINQYIKSDLIIRGEHTFKNITGKLINKKNDFFTPLSFEGRFTGDDFDSIPQYHKIKVAINEENVWQLYSPIKRQNSSSLIYSKQASFPTLTDYNSFLLLKKMKFTKIGSKNEPFNLMELYGLEFYYDNYFEYIANEEIVVNGKKSLTKVILLQQEDRERQSVFWIDDKNNVVRFRLKENYDFYTLCDKEVINFE